MQEEIWPSLIAEYWNGGDLVGCSGRMYQVSLQATTDEIFTASLVRWRNSGMGFATGCWTQSISESPRIAVESSSSDILETTDPLPKYFLSQRACVGFMNRFLKYPLEEQQMPPLMREALESCIVAKSKTTALDPTASLAQSQPETTSPPET